MKRFFLYIVILVCAAFFYSCMGIKTLSTDSRELWYLENGNLLLNREYVGNIPNVIIVPLEVNGNKVRCISPNAFKGCDFITEVVIPDSVICIGESSFADCINLRKVILPNTLRYIEDYAFYHCYSLCEVNIPDSVVSIGKDAFPCGSITMNDNSLHNLYENYVLDNVMSGQTLNDVISQLGEPDWNGSFIVDESYEDTFYLEPDYWRYFSDKMIQQGVSVFLFYWELCNRRIYLWTTKNNESYVVFSSIDYDSRNVMF